MSERRFPESEGWTWNEEWTSVEKRGPRGWVQFRAHVREERDGGFAAVFEDGGHAPTSFSLCTKNRAFAVSKFKSFVKSHERALAERRRPCAPKSDA